MSNVRSFKCIHVAVRTGWLPRRVMPCLGDQD
jgi:hypothetical protein